MDHKEPENKYPVFSVLIMDIYNSNIPRTKGFQLFFIVSKPYVGAIYPCNYLLIGALVQRESQHKDGCGIPLPSYLRDYKCNLVFFVLFTD